jgi:hypothetical protein
MDTTTAAQTAGVTVATIRAWCRRNVIAATKTSGRWTIDPASLRQRVELSKALRKAAAQRQADAGRARILAALRLPALTGTPKQIAWAQELRHQRIEQALTAHVTSRGEITYRLATPYNDALGVTYLNLEAEHRTEADALTALQTAATTGARHTASWWIDNRDQHAPMG